MPALNPPFQHSKFQLDASAVAGLLGGEESFSALKNVYFSRGRRWLGWYNSPGSLFIAKECGTIAVSHLWDWLFPGPGGKPTKTLELDNWKGPRYTGIFSGTHLQETEHLARLLAYHCKERVHKHPLEQGILQGTSVTIVVLDDKHGLDFNSSPDVTCAYLLPFNFFSLIPVLFSIGAATMCALWSDWYCFTVIIFGSISNGVTTFLLGSGILQTIGPKSSDKSPPGDGLLFDTPDIIILQGSEKMISRIIRGRYEVHYASTYHRFGIGSFLLLLHTLSQLVLIPQGTLIGQILFLATLVISWTSVYASSLDHQALQTDVLLNILGNPVIYKFNAGKWTNAATLVTKYSNPKEPSSIIQELIPNRTPAWDFWRACVAGAAQAGNTPSQYAQTMREPAMEELSEKDQKFVKDFLQSADEAFLAAGKIENVIQRLVSERPMNTSLYP